MNRLRVPWPTRDTFWLGLRSPPGKMAAENKMQLEEFSWQAADSPSFFGGTAQPWPAFPFLVSWVLCWWQHLCVSQRYAQEQSSAPSWFIFQTKTKILRLILVRLGFVISASSLDFPNWEG